MSFLSTSVKKDILNAFNVLEIIENSINNEEPIFNLKPIHLQIIKKYTNNSKDLSLLIYYFSGRNQIKAYMNTFNCSYENANSHSAKRFKKIKNIILLIKEEFAIIEQKEIPAQNIESLNTAENYINDLLNNSLIKNDLKTISKCIDVLNKIRYYKNPHSYTEYKTEYKHIKDWLEKK